jgi:O-antigen/teichoic acid export membrane protein
VVEDERLTEHREGAAPVEPDLLDTPDAGPAAIRGGALRLVGYGGGIVLALASVPLLVRHLGVVDFGRYALVVSIIAVVQGLTEGGLQAIGVREFSVLPQHERDMMMRRLMALRVLATAAGVGLALIFDVLAGYDSTIIAGTLVAGAGLLLLVIFNLLAVPLQASLRFGWVTVADLARQGLATVLIIALVIAGAGIVPLLAVQIPASALAVAITFALARKMTTLRPTFDPAAWWSLLKDTLPYAVAIAVSALYFRITIVIMSLVSTETQTGYFAASYRIIEALVAIPVLLVSAAFPILSRAARDDADRLLYAGQRTFDVMVALGVFVTICVAFGARYLIDFIGGAEFEPSIVVLRIQAFAVTFTFLSVTCGFILLALHRHRAILLGNLVPLAFGAALTLALAPAHGARGAAIATVVGEAGLAAAMLLLAFGHRPGRVPGSLRAVPQVALAAGAAGLVGLVCISQAPEYVAAVIAPLVYLAVLYPLGLIPGELREAVLARRQANGVAT